LLRIAFTAAAVVQSQQSLSSARELTNNHHLDLQSRALSSETHTYLQPDQSGAPAEPAQPPSKNSEAEAAARTAAQGRGGRSRSAWASSSLPARLLGACPAPAPLCLLTLLSLRISLKQVADRIEPIRGNGQKCHGEQLYIWNRAMMTQRVGPCLVLKKHNSHSGPSAITRASILSLNF
jgi:hypothetical protein